MIEFSLSQCELKVAPLAGVHAVVILDELGYSKEGISSLGDDKVIGVA